ncbi:cilia- and flagella-associated protein 263 isoform X2 [Stigmatopora argus]
MQTLHSNQNLRLGNKHRTSMETQNLQDAVHSRIQHLQSSNAALLAENELFESFLRRIDQQESLTQPVGLPEGGTSHLEDDQTWEQTNQGTLCTGLQQLTLRQKLCVAQKETAEVIRVQQKDKGESETILENYHVSLKELEQQRADIRKEKSDFECRLLKARKTSEMKELEKVLQHMRSKATQCDQLKLKIQSLKAREKKLQFQLQEKNKQAETGLEELFLDYSEPTVDLEELRVKLLQAQRNLSFQKEELQRVTIESSQMSRDITKMTVMLKKIEEDILHAQEVRSKAEAQNKQLHRQMSTYQAPDVMHYMDVKDKHKQLQQTVRAWQRKVAIAEMTFKSKSFRKHGDFPKSVKLPDIAHGKA